MGKGAEKSSGKSVAVFAMAALAIVVCGVILVPKVFKSSDDGKKGVSSQDTSDGENPSSETETGDTGIDDVDLSKVIAASAQNGQIADHVRGSAKAKVLIIEYGDFQCPGCGSMSPRLNALVDEYKESEVALIFRNFPLSMHPNAVPAAAAAEAAGLQGKYWEMHDLIYKNQVSWSGASSSDLNGIFAGMAEGLGIDRTKFLEDMRSESVSKKITFDKSTATDTLKLTGTPSILIDGDNIPSETWSYDAKFKSLIDSKLK